MASTNGDGVQDLARQPYYIRRADGRPLALAGLWASWHDPERTRDDSPLRSATILTTGPNSLMGQIHNRMPVILSEFDWDRWLDPTLTDPTSFFPLLGPAPDDLLEAIPVGPLSTRLGTRDGSWSKRSAPRWSSEGLWARRCRNSECRPA